MRGQLARAQGQAEKLSQQQSAVLESAQSQIAASNAQLGKFKGAYDELLVLARTKESERAGRRAGPARRAGQELRRQEPRDVPGRQGHPECLASVSTGDMMAMPALRPQRAREVRGTGAGVRRQAVRRADPGLGSDAGPNQINPQGNDDDRPNLILDVSAERLQEVLQSAGYRVTVSGAERHGAAAQRQPGRGLCRAHGQPGAAGRPVPGLHAELRCACRASCRPAWPSAGTWKSASPA